jgi:predicted PurR-regulated permease PerM
MNEPRERPVDDTSESEPKRQLMRRVALIDGIGALFLLLLAGIWFAADALLLLFACILFAVLLHELSGVLQHRLHVPRKIGLPAIVLVLFAVIGLGGWLVAPQISDEWDRLTKEVPAGLQRLRALIDHHPMLKRVTNEFPSPADITKHLSQLVPNAGLFFGGVLGALGNVVIILFVGIYLAASPRMYTGGIIRLVPQSKRKRAREVLDHIGHSLARWLVGKALSMLIVGVVTSVGLSLLGVPLALILGIIAGLLDFIPYIGPILGGVPAVLLAFSISPELALYTILLFVGVQTVEGYVLQPFVEARAVEIPPALTIVMQLIFGSLFGFAGVALATPLTAVLTVLVKMLYVQDVLGDRRERPA